MRVSTEPLFHHRRKLKSVLEDLSSKYRQELTQILVIFFLIIAVFHPILNDKTIPKSLGSLAYTTAFTVYHSLDQYGIESVWHPFLGGGTPLFLADSPLFYHNIGFMHTLFSKTDTRFTFLETFNLMVFNFVVLIGLSVFYLTRITVPKNFILGTLTPHIFLTTYSFVHYLSFFGAVKWLSSIPLLIVVLAQFLDRKRIDWIEVGFFSALAIIHHFVASLEFLIICFFVLVISSFIHTKSRRKAHFISIKKPFFSALLFLTLASVYLFPTLYYLQYTTPKHVGYTIPEFFENYSSSLPRIPLKLSFFADRVWDILSLNAQGSDMLISILFFVSLVYVVSLIYVGMSSSLSNTFTLFASFILFLLLCGIGEQLSIGKNMEFGRQPQILFTLLVCVIVIDAFKTISSKKEKTVLLLICIYLSFSSYFAYSNLKEWYAEDFITDNDFKPIISELNTVQQDGRWITFGWEMSIDALLPTLSSAYTSLEHFDQAHHTRTIRENVRGDFRGEARIYNAHNADYLINQMINTGTRYIWFDTCMKEGSEVAEKLGNRVRVFAIDNIGCNQFAVIDNSSLAETVVPSNTNYLTEEIYSKPGGHSIVWIVNPKHGGFEQPPHQGRGDLKKLSLTRPTLWSIVVSGDVASGDWVLIKEKYSPVWGAMQDNESLPVYKSNTGMMLVYSNSEKPIHLSAEPLLIQKVFALVTLFAVFYLWLRLKSIVRSSAPI